MALLLRLSSRCLFPRSSPLLRKHDVPLSVHFSAQAEEQTVDSISVSEYLMQKHGFSLESASKIASYRSRMNKPEKFDLVVSFLKESGFSKPQLEIVLKYKPVLLWATLDTSIKPQIKILQDLGFTADEISHIVTRNPQVLKSSVDKKIIPSLSVLKNLLGSNEEVAKVLKKSVQFLTCDLEKTLLRNIELLESCGVHRDQIIRLMFAHPRLLLNKPQTMKKFIEKVDEMGVDRSSRMFIHAVRVVGSMTGEIFKGKMKNLMNLGFSQDDMLRVFRTVPGVLASSEEKIKNVTTVLLETGKYQMANIVNYPTSLMYSVEGRYRPRIGVLCALEERNLIQNWPAFTTFYLMTNEEFMEKFVTPYLDHVGEIFPPLN